MNIRTYDNDLRTLLQVGGLAKADTAVMPAVRGYILPMIPALTDHFCHVLASEPDIAPYVDRYGRLLQRAQAAWLESLFSGDYGSAFIHAQERIGESLVRTRVPPLYLAASMSFLRGALPRLLAAKIPDQASAVTATAIAVRLIDLCHYLIYRKYSELLMENLGVSPALLVRLQTVGRSSGAKARRH